MKSIDPFPEGDEAVTNMRHGGNVTYSASRVLVGHCPDCSTPLVLFNDGEAWPLAACACGWRGDTLSFTTVRADRDPGVRVGEEVGSPPLRLRIAGQPSTYFNTRTPQGNITRATPTESIALFAEPADGEPERAWAVLIYERGNK